jgi:HD-GYP domain-containing protein (c-di-GMP phosphodiesterase class II)
MISHPDDCQQENVLLERLWRGEIHEYSLEKRYLRQEGSEVWVDLTVSAMWEAGEEPTLHIAVVQDITARKQAEGDLRRRISELEAVNRISSGLSSAEQLSQMLPVLLDEILQAMDVQVGGIALNLPATRKTDFIEARGWVKNARRLFEDPENGLIKFLSSHLEPLCSQDFSADPRIDEPIRNTFPAGWGGVIMPVQAVNEALGLILVSVQKPRELSQFETSLLDTIAQIAGNAIHRMRLYEQTQRNLKRIATLHDIDTVIRSNLDLRITLGIILEHVVQQLNVDAASVMLADDHSPYLQQTAGRGFHTWTGEQMTALIGEGVAGRAALERQRVKGTLEDFAHEPPIRVRIFQDEHFQTSFSVPLVSRGKVVGVLEVFKRSELDPGLEWLSFLGTLAGQVALAVEDLGLLESLHQTNMELVLAYDETIEGWSRAMDLRDRETEGHTRRVTEMTITLAQAMGLPDETIVQLRRGAMLHDIGKMGVPDDILHKPGPLTDDEWVIMHRHPQQAYDLLSSIAYLEPALDIPYCHHEKWDGSGYPRGLRGEQIPLTARLFAVVDVYDALSSDRPYRKAWTKEKCLAYIVEQSEKYFDPAVIEVFLRLFGE